MRRIEGAGRPLGALTPAEGFDLMAGFYREERAEGCRTDDDSDMLLYQWGTYDWGAGEFFELDITRQLITGGEDDDIFQLSLTFRFRPADALRQLGAGNRWCHSPDDLEDLMGFIYGSAPFQALGREAAADVKLLYGIAG